MAEDKDEGGGCPWLWPGPPLPSFLPFHRLLFPLEFTAPVQPRDDLQYPHPALWDISPNFPLSIKITPMPSGSLSTDLEPPQGCVMYGQLRMGETLQVQLEEKG